MKKATKAKSKMKKASSAKKVSKHGNFLKIYRSKSHTKKVLPQDLSGEKLQEKWPRKLLKKR